MNNQLNHYEKRGFEGSDGNLATSLYEYGLIWREYRRAVPEKDIRKGEYIFIYGTQINLNQEYTHFEWSCLHPDEFESHFDWVAFKPVAAIVGLSEKEFKRLPFIRKTIDLIAFYGTQNIFGGPHGTDFEIKSVYQNNN